MLVTYLAKIAFLFLSWLILFTGLNGLPINSAVFFASVLIYTGSIVFDLIFLCIDTNARAGKLENGIYCISSGLAFFNGILAIVEIIGAFGGFNIILNGENRFIIVITQSGLTKVFPDLLSWELGMHTATLIVLIMGLSSIAPGFLMLKLKSKQKQS